MLIGNLTRDPELRHTPSGTPVCTFGLATNRSWTPADSNEAQEETEYHSLVAWSKLAEICSQLLYKGRKIYCEGRLQTRKWTGQDGQERTRTEVVIDNMIALGGPKNAGGNGGYGEGYSEEYSGGYEPASNATSQAPYQAPAATPEPVVTPEPETASNAAAQAEEEPTKEADTTQDVDTDDIPF
jgi:single-strand DNA-binding protein